MLYLPTARAVRLIGFGFDNALSDLIWFNTINYFGKHYRGNRDYRWLGQMCNLVTDLNPKVTDIYEFCSSMLAWEAGDPKSGIEILSRAVEHNPNQWLYRYLRGFFYFYFLNQNEAATADFIAASKLPDAHPIVKALAARGLALNDPQTAIDFLTLTLKRSTDPSERKALTERLQQAIFERDIGTIEAALTVYRTTHGNPPRSLEELALSTATPLPKNNPWGEPYQLDSEGSLRIPPERKRLKQFYRAGGTPSDGTSSN
jgi:tetratricopeptide (TPR) repeat protein